MRARKFGMQNIGLKLFALVLAVLTWVYVVGEMGKSAEEERSVLYDVFPYRMLVKKITIKPYIVGEPFAGHRVIQSQVTVIPSQILIIGPKAIVEDLAYISTKPIDINEYTKSVSVAVPLAEMGKLKMSDKDTVTVTIPIEKIEPAPEKVQTKEEVK